MPVEDDETERRFAVLAHASALSGLLIPLGQLLGPYLVSLLAPRNSERARRHAAQALNFQLNMVALVVILACLLFWFRGGFWFLILLVPNLYAFCMAIWGSTRASRGLSVRYPLAVGILPAARHPPSASDPGT